MSEIKALLAEFDVERDKEKKIALIKSVLFPDETTPEQYSVINSNES